MLLQYFPRGSCGNATCLLAEFLEAEGFGQIDYVAGDRGNGHMLGSRKADLSSILLVTSWTTCRPRFSSRQNPNGITNSQVKNNTSLFLNRSMNSRVRYLG